MADPNKRIVIVDALRGFALMLIVFIHYVEHFDFFYSPETHFLFSPETDGTVMESVFFLISGKAYSIFALLFGFSFFIQLSRKEKVGIDFRGRFAWRLFILMVMGFVHSLLYKGDILHIYALLGFILIFLYNVKTRILYLVSFLLVIQIPLLYNLVLSFMQPGFEYVQSFGAQYWQEANQTYAHGSFFDVVSFNLWKGRATVWGWTFYNGRYLQLVMLFIAGLILGRKRVFENLGQHKKILVKVLIYSSLFVALCYGFNYFVSESGLSDTQKQLINTLVTSYANLAFTATITTILMLVYLKFSNHIIFTTFAAYGKMSLTNYVSQAVFGVLFFYGFGLGMYRYLGSTWSLLLGVLVFIIQAVVSFYWTRNFYYGPLEWLWRSLTFLDFRTNVKKGRTGPTLVSQP